MSDLQVIAYSRNTGVHPNIIPFSQVIHKKLYLCSVHQRQIFFIKNLDNGEQ
jgi:hypothetical protein